MRCQRFSLLMHSTIQKSYYKFNFSYVDYRINATNIAGLKSISNNVMSNPLIGQYFAMVTIVVKLSTVIFNIIMFFTIIMALYKRRNEKNYRKFLLAICR